MNGNDMSMDDTIASLPAKLHNIFDYHGTSGTFFALLVKISISTGRKCRFSTNCILSGARFPAYHGRNACPPHTCILPSTSHWDLSTLPSVPWWHPCRSGCPTRRCRRAMADRSRCGCRSRRCRSILRSGQS